MKSLKTIIKNKFPSFVRTGREIQYSLLGALPANIIFTRIYNKRIWANAETVSGAGSTIDATQTIRKELPGLLKELNAGSLLDIPCGDFHWMKDVNLALERYIGADIVTEIIESNNRNFYNERRSFVRLDIITDDLPTADVILCRDCLVHLSEKNVLRALANIKRSSSTYLISTTFPEVRQNSNIPTGSFRPINLCLPPFNLPPPLKTIFEYSISNVANSKKCLGVWRIDEM